MKVMAINGSPRKNWNTATLLEKLLKVQNPRAQKRKLFISMTLSSKDASCFACKVKVENLARCSIKDELTPVLERLEVADAVILGSPIYLGNSTGEMRSFMERIYFRISLTRLTFRHSIRRISQLVTFTMNIKEEKF